MTSTSHLSRMARAAIAALVGTVLLWATPPAHAAESDSGSGGKTNIARAVNKAETTPADTAPSQAPATAPDA